MSNTLYLLLDEHTDDLTITGNSFQIAFVAEGLDISLRGHSYTEILISDRALSALTQGHGPFTAQFKTALNLQLLICVATEANLMAVDPHTLIKSIPTSDFTGPNSAPSSDPRLLEMKGEDAIAVTRKASSSIWVTFSRIGIHRYPDAPEEVAYLRDAHRHNFKFKVQIQVHHNDRDIEFHMLLNWLQSLYDTKVLELDFKSCEMLAEDVIAAILAKYDCTSRRVEVTVSEDDECGALVVSQPS